MRGIKVDVSLNLGPTQYDVLHGLMSDLFDIGYYIGGRGSGKSTTLGLFIVLMTELPYSVGLLTAPVFDTLNNTTMPGILEAFEMMGLVEGRDYVVGTPPRRWGIKVYQKLRKAKCMYFRNGSVVILDGSDNYNKHRGIELDWVAIDEIGNLKEQALDVYIGGLRGKATKRAGRQQKLLGVGNPPEDPYQIEKWRGRPGVEVFTAPTHENAANLPPGYIARMRASYDQLTYEREVLGLLKAVGGLLACYAMQHKAFPDGNYSDRKINATGDLFMTWDFNASSERPMSTLLVQRQRFEVGGKQIDLDVTVKEFVNLGTDTHTQCDIIYDWLKASGFRGKLHIRGDATGGDRARGSAATQSDYQVIETKFRSSGPWQFAGVKTRRTKRVKNRMTALNSRFRNADGEIRMLINPEQCPKLIEATKHLRWSSNQYDLEENAHKDPIDAFSYYPYYDFPVHRKTAQKAIIR